MGGLCLFTHFSFSHAMIRSFSVHVEIIGVVVVSVSTDDLWPEIAIHQFAVHSSFPWLLFVYGIDKGYGEFSVFIIIR